MQDTDLGTAFFLRLSRTFFLGTFSVDYFEGNSEKQEEQGDEHQGKFFLSSFTFVGGNISVREDSSLSFYQIQMSYRTSVTNSLSVIYISNTGPDDRSY